MHEWRKSTFSTTQACVQVKRAWRKSSHSAEDNCVEVGRTSHGEVWVRDSKDKTSNGEILQFSPTEWEEILDQIHAHEFPWNVTFHPLIFTDEERHAFELGVLAGEFDLQKEHV